MRPASSITVLDMSHKSDVSSLMLHLGLGLGLGLDVVINNRQIRSGVSVSRHGIGAVRHQTRSLRMTDVDMSNLTLLTLAAHLYIGLLAALMPIQRRTLYRHQCPLAPAVPGQGWGAPVQGHGGK